MATNVTTSEPDGKIVPAEGKDRELQVFREKVTAQLALGVVIIFALCIAGAFVYIGDQEFAHVKDILSMLTPILGVVLGFYFNKASTERRAESAEQTAERASDAARQASEERAQAQTEAAAATESLEEISTAAEDLLNAGVEFPEPADDAGGPLADDVGAGAARRGRWPADSAPRIRLEQALERARRRRR